MKPFHKDYSEEGLLFISNDQLVEVYAALNTPSPYYGFCTSCQILVGQEILSRMKPYKPKLTPEQIAAFADVEVT